jgi:hypothetical protein
MEHPFKVAVHRNIEGPFACWTRSRQRAEEKNGRDSFWDHIASFKGYQIAKVHQHFFYNG